MVELVVPEPVVVPVPEPVLRGAPIRALGEELIVGSEDPVEKVDRVELVVPPDAGADAGVTKSR